MIVSDAEDERFSCNLPQSLGSSPSFIRLPSYVIGILLAGVNRQCNSSVTDFPEVSKHHWMKCRAVSDVSKQYIVDPQSQDKH